MAENYMVYARDLSITWGNDSRYWRWSHAEETSGHTNEVAELIIVWWLEVQGKFDTTNLPHEKLYEVSFVVKLENHATGWNITVKISLSLPNGNKQEILVDMSNRPREQWLEISAGMFRTCPENLGEIKFSFSQVDTNYFKKGLVIKGAKIICCDEKDDAKEQIAVEEQNVAEGNNVVAKEKDATEEEDDEEEY
ncbi:hypothetical protein TIFTF001_023712 [Ficus carica]|uniref:Uncharacterized protein n=1 Tax=Ficus carica TaxID=3494 RepID=A0AA88AX77_FICCA|nr:hypothetical protein TIFTF001_023712 [Ficus carica]